MIGIDISKDTFDVAFSCEGKHYRVATYSNTTDGIAQFIHDVERAEQCVMEATGPYWYRLAMQLTSDGFCVSVVNPLQIKRFAQMQLRRTKTDAVDACIICAYGERMQPPVFVPPQPYLTRLKQLRSVLGQLIKTRTDFSNQLHAHTHMHLVDTVAVTTCKAMIATVTQQIEDVEDAMERLIEEHCPALYEQLQTIPAIGKKAARELIIAAQQFVTFTNPKQFASYIGLCPRMYQSGTSVKGKGHICKVGMSQTRKILYLCSLSAIRWNKACKVFYERLLVAGKSKMVALIAVANKLLKQVFALVKQGTVYDENFCPKPCF